MIRRSCSVNPHVSGPLPIDAVLPDLTAALSAHSAAVLVAPPGAGKTTRVPLVLAGQEWAKGRKIIVLEPRRLAARAAAARMAAVLNEPVGATIGYRVRFGSRISRNTRIELLTEGVFTRLVLADPSLEASPPFSSTSFTNARSTPISAWRWPATRSRGCGKTSGSWSCRPPSMQCVSPASR